jgi:outer membrane immunogenic protein
MKRILLAGLVVGSCSTLATAGDLGPYDPVPTYEPRYETRRDMPWSWDGFYLGANAGYGWGAANNASLNGPVSGSIGSLEPDGWFGGGQIGYNVQFNRLVIGVEGDLQAADIDDGVSRGIGGYATQADVAVDWFSTLRARVGFTADSTLIYATGGLALADVDYTVSGSNGVNSFSSSSSSIETGYAVGGGVEWAISPEWSMKTEYLYVDLGDKTLTTPGSAAGTFSTKTETEFHTVRLGLNYQF